MEKIKIEEIEKLVGLTGCRVDRINCIIIIMAVILAKELS